jgi:hypothetical protein
MKTSSHGITPGPEPSRAEKTENSQNKLLEAPSGERPLEPRQSSFAQALKRTELSCGAGRRPEQFETVQLKLIQMVGNFGGIAHFVVIRYCAKSNAYA